MVMMAGRAPAAAPAAPASAALPAPLPALPGMRPVIAAAFMPMAARATHRFKSSDHLRAFTVGLVGTNLRDGEVRNHVSSTKDEVLLAGRNARLYATVRW